MPMFVVNGKTYTSLDEMPPEIRQAYEQAMGVLRDENQNGLPDILEGKTGPSVSSVQTILNLPTAMQIIADGKTYSSVDEMPAETRLTYDQAMSKLGPLMSDADGNGIPDVFEGKQPAMPGTSQPERQAVGMVIPAGEPQNPPPSVISDETPFFSAKSLVFLLLLFLVVLLGIAAFLMITWIK